jgi:hypothetical protein
MLKIGTDWFQRKQSQAIKDELEMMTRERSSLALENYAKLHKNDIITVDINRVLEGDNTTIGNLSINNRFFCNTLEDLQRDRKLKTKTAIPEGNYPITLREVGGFFQRYTKLFNETHPMLWIRAIPNFTYVLIHMGTKHTHTAGCILVGSSFFSRMTNDYVLTDSKDKYLDVYHMLSLHLTVGGKVQLRVRNNIHNPKHYTGKWNDITGQIDYLPTVPKGRFIKDS